MNAIFPGDIRLIAGLGNPGPEYERTYHNAGMFSLDALAEHLGASQPKRERLYSYRRAGALVLITPRTFMNESGKAIRQALMFFRIPPEKLLVIHDESDIPVGIVKLQHGHGAAGHRGVESVIRELRTKDFWRLRVGVRSAPGKAGVFVLRNMRRSDIAAIYSAVAATTKKLTEKENP